MLHPLVAKLIIKAPSSIMKPISRMITDVYLNKYANISIIDKENLDLIESPVIFVSNHLSNSDGLIINRVLNKYKPHFVAGVKLAEKPISRIGFEAVNTIPIKPNSADIEALKKCIESIKQGKNIFIFPEGTRSRTGEMIEGKKGIVLIAQKSNVPIIPLGITGSEKLMPINDEDMQSEKFQNAEIKIKVGKPIYISKREKTEDKDKYNEECLLKIMKGISELLPEEYRGVYK